MFIQSYLLVTSFVLKYVFFGLFDYSKKDGETYIINLFPVS